MELLLNKKGMTAIKAVGGRSLSRHMSEEESPQKDNTRQTDTP